MPVIPSISNKLLIENKGVKTKGYELIKIKPDEGGVKAASFKNLDSQI